jgi:2,3-bisphosphoglycerate-dependent phosphoglycerate mutase
MAKLILARHHESEWNKLGKWTGLRDRHLTPYGFEKSAEMGRVIKDIHIDRAFASMKVRAIETLSCMLDETGQFRVPTEHTDALNERDYGDYTGKDKWQMHEILGEEKWNRLRREWDYPVPHGETLKMVSDRALPFYLTEIVPALTRGENVLVVAHGNSLRTLVKYIEHISDADIAHVEFPFGGIFIYEIDAEGHMVKKEERGVTSKVNA